MKHLPGRAKTDELDAVWWGKVAERQLIRPGCVPPATIRMLRDLTGYRVDLVAEAGAERHRAEKLLEDAQITLSVVASALSGVLGKIDGGRVDRRAASEIREVDAHIETYLTPFAPAAARLLEIPGVGPAAAAAIIAKTGVEMARFPTPAHLAGWAEFAPGVGIRRETHR